jgi:hypothetical protein
LAEFLFNKKDLVMQCGQGQQIIPHPVKQTPSFSKGPLRSSVQNYPAFYSSKALKPSSAVWSWSAGCRHGH